MINKKLSNMLSCISELESTVNKMGLKQDTLINLVNLTNDLISTYKAEPTPSEKKRPDMTFSKFSPCLASFYLDPPNIIPKKSDKRRERNRTISLFFFPLYSFNIINISSKQFIEKCLVNFSVDWMIWFVTFNNVATITYTLLNYLIKTW